MSDQPDHNTKNLQDRVLTPDLIRELTLSQISSYIEEIDDNYVGNMMPYIKRVLRHSYEIYSNDNNINSETSQAIANLITYYALAYKFMESHDKLANARQGKKKKYDVRRIPLRTAIIAETTGIPLKKSDKFAISILQGVKKRMNVTSDWPSAKTVRREIKAILAECAENEGHT